MSSNELVFASGYKPFNGFKDVFSSQKAALTGQQILKASWIDTPLGPMLAIANDDALFLLEFKDRRGLEREIERLATKTKSVIIPGVSKPIHSIEKELKQYFAGNLSSFKTPLFFVGTLFQKRVWDELRRIPLGETCSYSDIATALGKPTAYRAVALANGSNQIAIVIPCHRVIKADGDLCGYAGGLTRKKWLLDHEKR